MVAGDDPTKPELADDGRPQRPYGDERDEPVLRDEYEYEPDEAAMVGLRVGPRIDIAFSKVFDVR